MPIVCTKLDRFETVDSQAIQCYLETARSYPSPGWAFSIPGESALWDFSDPSRLRLRNGEEVLGETKITGRERVLKFPNPKGMTNVLGWNHYAFCFAEGVMWALDRQALTWNVVVVNEIQRDNESNSPQDLVCTSPLDPDAFMLIKFIPSREHCEQVVIRHFKLAHVNYLYINPSLNTAPSKIEGNASPTTDISSQKSTQADMRIDPCKICFTEDASIPRSAIVPCGHVSCSECIQTALKENNSICPFCRGTVDCLLRLFE